MSISTLHLSSAAAVELTQNQIVSKRRRHLILQCSPMEEEGKGKRNKTVPLKTQAFKLLVSRLPDKAT